MKFRTADSMVMKDIRSFNVLMGTTTESVDVISSVDVWLTVLFQCIRNGRMLAAERDWKENVRGRGRAGRKYWVEMCTLCKTLLHRILSESLRLYWSEDLPWPFINTDHTVNICSRSDDSPHFEKPFEIVDLSEGHGDEDKSLKEWPHHDTWVCVVVNCTQQQPCS